MSMLNLKEVGASVKKNFVFYILGLILNREKKNCTSMAKVLNRSHDALYRFLMKYNIFSILFPSFFIKMANYFAKQKPGYLIIDDSAISKAFAQNIEKLSWVYNSSIRRPERGLCLVVIAWSNGDVTIPLKFTWWFSKKIMEKELYKTKIQHAYQLIDDVKDLVKFEYFLADGLYFSKDMAQFLEERSIKFVMRCASNRKITTTDGVCEQAKHHRALRLKRNNHSAVVLASYGSQSLYFIAQKRRKKNNEWIVVYFVSNIEMHRSDYVKLYGGRWNIEPLFRTAKSNLGLSHCSALCLEKQGAHVFAVFFAYNFLQFQKKRHKLQNPEAALSTVRQLKVITLYKAVNAFSQLFELFA